MTRADAPAVANGWTLFAHPLFLDQLESLAVRRHWFRAKFFQQYRLFFRYHRAQRIIVYAWVNDEQTRCARMRPGNLRNLARGATC